MILNNVEIYNAAESFQDPDGGFGFLRVPADVESHLNDTGKMVNRGTTGVELRFVLKSGDAKVIIRNAGAGVISN
ncbi:MAG: hypothetical protein IJ427_10635, partial [Lachnospiraceae bacterium]|nr:hypothetical protein [Lachnospiraceae bacterium]